MNIVYYYDKNLYEQFLNNSPLVAHLFELVLVIDKLSTS